MQKLFKALLSFTIFTLFLAPLNSVFGQCPPGTTGSDDIDIVFNPPPNPDGSFDAGTTVEICATITNFPGTGGNWMHGFAFTFPSAWDVSSTVIVNAPDECGNDGGEWLWVEGGINGYGPGFYFDVNEGGPEDGNPANNWGDLCGAENWDFCIEVTLGPPAGDPGFCGGPGNPLNGTFITPTLSTTGDGNTGSWINTFIPPCNPSEPITMNCCDAEPGISPGTLPICVNGITCLFDDLLGTPASGGVWDGPPGWTSGGTDCGSFDPENDPAGDYTYTVSGTGGCFNSATITMGVLDLGLISNVVHCDPGLYDLFLIPPTAGLPSTGDWYEPGTYPDPSGIVPGGLLDPTTANPGVYVYSFYDAGNCLTTASVNVIFSTASVGGCETWIDLCTEEPTFAPFDFLDCGPAPGGQWILYRTSDNLFLGYYLDSDLTFGCAGCPPFPTEDVYLTYILGAVPCAPSFADLHVTLYDLVNTGLATETSICVTDPPIVLETLLDEDGNGPVDLGLDWVELSVTPGGQPPITNLLDPSLYLPNTQLQLFYEGGPPNSLCYSSTLLTLNILPADANAGLSNTIDICVTDAPFDMFNFLLDDPAITPPEPQTGGSWTDPSGNPFGSFYTPGGGSNPGTYTYTIISSCDADIATLTINEVTLPDAGADNVSVVCESIGNVNLTSLLGGTPAAGGAWTVTGSATPVAEMYNVTGQCNTSFNFTYTVSVGSCTNSADLTMDVECAPDAGPDVTATYCEDGTVLNLVGILDPGADAGGVFSPVSTVVLLPVNSQVFTYTVSGTNCAPDVANYTINIVPELATAIVTTICEANQTEYVPTFNITGGTAPYTVSGGGVLVGAAYTGATIPVGTPYSFTISDSGPCPDIVVSGVSPVCDCLATAQITSGNTLICEGGCTDIAIANSNGVLPFTVEYSDGTNTFTEVFSTLVGTINVCPTATTTYSLVSVSDANCVGTTIGGSVSVSVEQQGDAGPDVIISAVCADGSALNLNGELDPAADGGGTWNPTSPVILNPGNAGVFNYTVSGAACPSDAATYTLSIEEGLSISNLSVACETNQTEYVPSFDIVGGTPPYTVSGGGGVVGSTFTGNTIPVGTPYSFTISDSGPCPDIVVSGVSPVCDCLATAEFTSPNTTVCQGSCANLVVTPSGGVAPYTIEFTDGINPPQTHIWNTVADVISVCPSSTTTYSIVSVEDANCIGTAGFGTTTVSVEIPQNAGPDISLDYCGDGTLLNLNTALDPAADGGGTWNPTSPVTLSPGNTGVYTYSVNGVACAADIAEYVVVIYPEVSADAPVAVCTPDQTEYIVTFGVLTGALPYNVSGGTMVTATQFESDPIAAGTPFNFTISDNGPCPDIVVNGVSPNCACLATAEFTSPNTTVCEGSCTNLVVTPSGGVAPYTIEFTDGINPPQTHIWNNVADVISVCPANTTTYSIVNVEDANCIGTAGFGTTTVSVETPQNAGPDATFDYCGDGTLFNLNSVLDPAADGGGLWSPVGTILLDPANSGIYTYTVSGSTCPTDAATYTLNIEEVLSTSNLSVTCEASQTEYIPSFDITGGTAPYTVSGGGGGVAGGTFTGVTIPVGTPYSFTISDSGPCPDIVVNGVSPNCNCTVTAQITSGNTLICEGSCTDISIASSNGVLPFTVEYSDGTNTFTEVFSTLVGTVNVCPTTTTTYSLLSVSDANCVGTIIGGSITISIEQQGDAGLDIVLAPVCGDGTVLNLLPLLDPTADPNGIFTPSQFVTLDQANSGIYTYIVSGAVCPPDAASYTLNIEEVLSTSNVLVACEANQTEYVSIFDIAGGTPPYSVTGMNGGSITGNTFTGIAISEGIPYSFTISDSGPCPDIVVNGTSPVCACLATTEFTSPNTAVCQGSCTNLVVTSSGIPPFTVEFSNGVIVQQVVLASINETISVCPANTTTYSIVSVVDANCIGTAGFGTTTISVEIPQNAGPDATLDYCGDGTLLNLNSVLDPTADGGGTWNPTSPVILNPGNAGVYAYTVNGAECAADNAQYVVVIAPEVTTTAPVAVCTPDQTEYTVTFGILTGALPYNVSGGTMITATQFESDPIAAGTPYSFTISDSGPCPDVFVNGVSPNCICTATAEITSGNTLICEGSCTDITIDNSNGVLPFTVEYSDGANTFTEVFSTLLGTINVCPTATTTYSLLSVSDANCVGTIIGGSITISIEEQGDAGLDIVLAPVCGDGTVLDLMPLLDPTADPNGIFTPSQFVTLDPANSGVYTYTVSGAVCPPDAATYTLNIEEELSTSNLSVACEANQTEYIPIFDIAGGTPPYSVSGGGGVVVGGTFTGATIPDGTPYSFTISDSGPCPDVFVNGVSPNCVCTATAQITSGNTLICEGSCTDITIANSNGVLPFTVEYSDGANTFTEVFSILLGTINVCPTATTTYSLLSVSDANCVGTIIGGSTTISIEQQGDAGLDIVLAPVCGDGTVLDLMPLLDPTADPNGIFTPSQFVTLDPANSGVYTYTVSGAVCPSDAATYTFNIEEVLSTSNLSVACEANQTEYIPIFDIAGGTPPYTVSGMSGGSITGNTFSGNPITAGTPYSFTISDSGPCSDIVVSGVSPNCVCTATAQITSGNTLICEGSCTDISITNGNGILPFTVEYSDGTNTFTEVFSTMVGTINVCPTATTTYSLVSVSDANCVGMTIAGDVAISVEPQGDAGLDVILDYCGDGTNLDLNTILDPGANLGGTWIPSSIVQLIPSNTGVYTYTVTAAVCPSDAATYTLNIEEEISIANLLVACNPSQLDYTVTFELVGGTMPYIVNGVNQATATTYSETFTTGTPYNITVLGSGLCAQLQVSGVSPNCNCVATSSILTPNNTICEGSCTDIEFENIGTPPFTIVYNDGVSDNTISTNDFNYLLTVCPTTTITYALVSIEDANCVGSAFGSVSVSVETQLTAGPDVVTPAFCGDGALINLNAMLDPGANPGGSFNPSGSFPATPGASGIYTYAVSGTVCPDDQADYTVNIATELAATNIDAACLANQTEYIVTLVITGGTPPYSVPPVEGIIVGDQFTSANQTVGAAFSFTIADSGPCPELVVSGVSPNCNCVATSNILTANTSICVGSCTGIEFENIGTPPFTIVYNDGVSDNTITTSDFNYLLTVCPTAAATYTLVSIDDANCSGSAIGSATVSVEPQLTAGPDVELDFCGDGALINLFNELSPIANPSGSFDIAMPIIADASNSGIYTYTLSGTVCPDDQAEYTVNIDAELAAASIDASCLANQTEYIVTLVITGGTPPYSVPPVEGIIVGDQFTSANQTVGAPFSFTISDGGSCPDLLVNGASPNCNCSATSSILTSNTTICEGSCVDIEFENIGTPPFTIVYNDGGGDNTITTSDFNYLLTVCPLTTSTYALVSIDDANCSGSAFGNVTVSLETQLTAGSDAALDLCGDGALINLFNYLEADADLTGTFDIAMPIIADASNSGIYIYTVSGTVCSDDQAEYTLNIDAEIAATNIDASCLANQTDYVVIFTITGGTSPYSVDPADGTIIGDQFTSVIQTVGAPFSFTISDSGSCPDLLVNGASPNCNCSATSGILTSNSTICEGSCVDIEFENIGTPPFTIVYNDGGGDNTITTSDFNHLLTVCPPTTTTYALVSMDDANCSGSAFGSVTVSVETQLTAGSDAALDLCGDGSPINLFNYLEADADPTGTFDVAMPIISDALNSGIFTYTVSGSVCSDDQADYTVNIAAELAVLNIDAACLANQTDYVVIYTITGGTAPYSVDPADGTIIGDQFTSVIQTVGAPFSFTISDSGSCPDLLVNGASPNCNCSATSSILNSNTTICEGSCLDIEFENIGTPPFTIVYNDGVSNNTITTSDFNYLLLVCPISTTTYSLLSIEDANCTGSAFGSAIVSVETQLAAGLDVILDFCGDGALINLNALLDPSADLGGSFNPSGSFASTPLASGIYTYIVSGAICPDDQADYTVNIDAELAATSIDASCLASQTEYIVTYTITGGTLPYSIDPAEGTIIGDQFTSVIQTVGAAFSFTISDSGPCPDLEVNGASPNCNCSATSSILTSNTTICEGSCLDIEFENNGTPPFTIVYNDGVSDNTITTSDFNHLLLVCPTTTTTYSLVSIQDANCIGSAFGSVTVSVDQQMNAGSDVNLTFCNDGTPINLFNFLEADADPGGTFDNSNPTIAGVYTYTIGGNGCPDDQAFYNVTLDEVISISNLVASCNPNQTEYSVQFEIVGGVPPYLVNGSNAGLIGNMFDSGLIDFGNNPNYTFTISDNGSCLDLDVTGLAPDCNCAAQGSFLGATTICAGECADIELFAIGDGPFTITYEDSCNPGVQTTLTGVSNGHIISICPTADCTYTLISISDQFCEGDVTGVPVIVHVDTPILVNSVNEVIDADNENYQVVIALSGGDELTYNFSTSGGVYNNISQTYTSGPIICGSGYSITIGDDGVCPSVVVDNPAFDCGCVSFSGTISVTPEDVCIDGTVSAVHAGDEVMDGNDILEFILHDGVGGSIGNVLDRTFDGVFNMSSYAVIANQTYCIVAVVGTADFSGHVLLGDDCTSVSDCLPITIKALPTASMIGGAIVCPGESVDLSLQFTGTGPWVFTYTLNGGTDISGTANTNTITVSEPGDYTLVSVEDAFCIGTVAGLATVQNYATPTATMGGNPEVCEGSGDGPEITFTGFGPWEFVYTIDGVVQDTVTTNSSFYTLSAEESGMYVITYLNDNNCIGTVSGNLNVTIVARPTATIAGGGAVCDGDELPFEVTFTGVSPWTVTYTIDGIAQSPINSGNPTYQFDSGIEGAYALTVVTDDICFGDVLPSEVSLIVNPLPFAELEASTSNFCIGEEIELGIILDGVPPFDVTYVLNNDTIIITGLLASTTQIITPDGPVNAEILYVEDGSNPTCSTIPFSAVYIDAVALPNAPVLADDSLCAANGAIRIGVPSAPGLSYQWSPEDQLDDPTTSNPLFSPTGSTGPIAQTLTYVLNATNGSCSATDTMTIRIDPGPTARFRYTPDPVLTEDTEVFFNNYTIGSDAVVYYWEFDTLDTSQLENPTYRFPDGINDSYNITLTAIDAISGCMDVHSEILTIKPEMLIYIPNAFTPDGDGLNDLWGPVMKNVDPNNYRLTVFDRYGGLVFETSELDQKWNGSVNGSDYYAKLGVYVWMIEVKNSISLEEVEYKGTVTLVR